MRTVSIGRSSECDIVISDSNVSRKHAEITLSNGQYYFTDLSSNGSTVDGITIRNKRIAVRSNARILLANKVSLPWSRVFQLLPAPRQLSDEDETSLYNNPPANNSGRNNYAGSDSAGNSNNTASEDSLGFWWGLLSFLIPFVGFIMYFIWKDEYPNKAATAGFIGLISFGINLVTLLL